MEELKWRYQTVCFQYGCVTLNVRLAVQQNGEGGTEGWSAERIEAVAPDYRGRVDITPLCTAHGDLLEAIETAALRELYAVNGAEVSHG